MSNPAPPGESSAAFNRFNARKYYSPASILPKSIFQIVFNKTEIAPPFCNKNSGRCRIVENVNAEKTLIIYRQAGRYRYLIHSYNRETF